MNIKYSKTQTGRFETNKQLAAYREALTAIDADIAGSATPLGHSLLAIETRVATWRHAELQRMLAFAQRHDWGCDARIEGDALRVAGAVSGSDELDVAYVRSMRELRDWAGY